MTRRVPMKPVSLILLCVLQKPSRLPNGTIVRAAIGLLIKDGLVLSSVPSR